MQGGERESAESPTEVLRASVREAFCGIMAAEVDVLCGPRYAPAPGSCNHRAGSETGIVDLGGEKEKIRRLRVRHESKDEVHLESYKAASSQQSLFQEIVGLAAGGMSQRGLERSIKGSIGKSSVSRMWEEEYP